MSESVNLREQASHVGAARANRAARYNMTTVDYGVFAVTVWRDGALTAIAYVPISGHTEAWARDFCARQNQAPDSGRESDFIRQAKQLYWRHVKRTTAGQRRAHGETA